MYLHSYKHTNLTLNPTSAETIRVILDELCNPSKCWLLCLEFGGDRNFHCASQTPKALPMILAPWHSSSYSAPTENEEDHLYNQ